MRHRTCIETQKKVSAKTHEPFDSFPYTSFQDGYSQNPSFRENKQIRRNFPSVSRGKKNRERKIFGRDKKWKIRKEKEEREVYKRRENGKYKKRKEII